MSEDWTAIAAEVAEGIRSVGATDAGFVCTLIQAGIAYGTESDPISGPDILTQIVVLDFEQAQRNRDGTLTETTKRTLTVSTEGLGAIIPAKGDRVAIGVLKADVTSATETHIIGEVRPLAPAGVAVLYEADLVK